MRRAIAVVALAGLAVLLHATDVRAGAGQAGDPAAGKISGPAVSATVVINPTFNSGNIGETSIRLQKGTLFSAALFIHEEAADAAPVGWVLGCDFKNGAKSPAATADVVTLTDLRFVNNRIRSWVPGAVMTALFGQLGVLFDGLHRIPVITDVDNPVCTPVGTDFFLSFTAVIQFEDSTK